MSDNNLKTVFDAAVSGAILIVAVVVALIIWKVAQALGVDSGGGSDDDGTRFGEGSLLDGTYWEGPIW